MASTWAMLSVLSLVSASLLLTLVSGAADEYSECSSLASGECGWSPWLRVEITCSMVPDVSDAFCDASDDTVYEPIDFEEHAYVSCCVRVIEGI